jgi:hypothetical protein
MWYLHSHFEWLKLSYSSIQILLDVCLAAHLEEFLDGFQEMSNCCCLPGKAGGTPDSNSVPFVADQFDCCNAAR